MIKQVSINVPPKIIRSTPAQATPTAWTGCYAGSTLCKGGATAPRLTVVEVRRMNAGVGAEEGMDGAHHVGLDESGLESDLVNLTGVNLEQLSALPSSVLVMSLSRILTENNVAREQYAAFQNAI